MDLPEAPLGEASCRVPTGSTLGNPRVPTHNTDVRIVLTLVGGGEAKYYGGAEVAGCSLAEYEHQSVLLRGPDEALPRQDQTDSTAAAARTVSKERRDRRKKKLLKAEQGKETRKAQVAQATTPASHVHEDEDEEAEAANTARAAPTDEGEQQTESVMGMEGGERAAAQQEGEDRVLPTMTNEDV
jgi:hypothetical protein